MILRNSNVNNWEDSAILGSYDGRSGTNTRQCWWSFTLFMNVCPLLLLGAACLGTVRLGFLTESLESCAFCLVNIRISLRLHIRHAKLIDSVYISCLVRLGWCSSWLPTLIRLRWAKYVLIIEPVSVFLGRLLCLCRLWTIDDVLDVTSSGRWSLCRLRPISVLGHHIYAVVSKVCSWLPASVLSILLSLLWLFPLMLRHPCLL